MHADAARERGMIVNVDVATQQCAVGHHDVVAQPAIVGHVATGHEKVVAADRGDAVFFFGGAIDRHAFANAVRSPIVDLGIAAAIAHILRLGADDNIGIDVIVLADRHLAHDRDVVFQPRAAADADVGPDHAEGPDFDVDVDFGPVIDRGVFRDVTCHVRSAPRIWRPAHLSPAIQRFE